MAAKRTTRGGNSPAAVGARIQAAIMALPVRTGSVLSAETPGALAPAYRAIYDDLATLAEAQREALVARIEPAQRRTLLVRIYNTGRMMAATEGQAFPSALPVALSNAGISEDERTAVEMLMQLSRGPRGSRTRRA
jgi:hypothetical protein